MSLTPADLNREELLALVAQFRDEPSQLDLLAAKSKAAWEAWERTKEPCRETRARADAARAAVQAVVDKGASVPVRRWRKLQNELHAAVSEEDRASDRSDRAFNRAIKLSSERSAAFKQQD